MAANQADSQERRAKLLKAMSEKYLSELRRQMEQEESGSTNHASS